MSDYREVQHGLDALNRYFAIDEKKQAFLLALNECHPGCAEETFKLFNDWWQNTQLQTYIASISEHDPREDLHGRLSMWRAFGGSAIAKVALVIKIPLDIGSNVALNAILNPVGYFTDAELARELDLITSNINDSRDFLKKIDRIHLVTTVFMMLTTGVVCLKHEGFHEEREWRVMYSPKRMPSALIESAVEVINGVPQIIYKIPLENNSGAGITGLEPNELLDRIIIGPTQFPWAMYEAFVAALDSAGVNNAASRVFVSQIPVRN
jgi:hypothetical protein